MTIKEYGESKGWSRGKIQFMEDKAGREAKAQGVSFTQKPGCHQSSSDYPLSFLDQLANKY